MDGILKLGLHQLPGVWRHMLPEEVSWLKLPRERFALCESCPKVAVGDYATECRCCAYFPEVPNFLLGLALQDPESSEHVRKLVEEGNALPQGALASPGRMRRAVEVHAADRFGQEPDQTCPLKDPETHHCRIYRYRNSVCSTFFCSNDHGWEGRAFWEGLEGLVAALEFTLSRWAMDQLGVSIEDYVACFEKMAGEIGRLSTPEGAWSVEARKELWGDWFGRECEFFEACADLLRDHRESLFDIARAQELVESPVFDEAFREWLPEALRDAAPAPRSPDREFVPIDNLWYQVLLASRGLWDLGLHEGQVVLNPAAEIEAGDAQGVLPLLYGGARRRVTLADGSMRGDEHSLFFTVPEAKLLEVFREPQVLGEAFFARPEVEALADPRAFLAECMRRELLQLQSS